MQNGGGDGGGLVDNVSAEPSWVAAVKRKRPSGPSTPSTLLPTE